jgi:hypothetical protein
MAPPRPNLAPPLPYSPPAPPSPATAALERDVASFVHSLRTSRSDMTAPPNALNVRDAIQAICAQFGTDLLVRVYCFLLLLILSGDVL